MPRVVKRFVRYDIANACVFAFQMALVFTLVEILGVYFLLATAMGFVFQVVTSFTINRRWAFRTSKTSLLHGLGTTLVVSLSTLSIILIITYIGVTFLALPFIVARLCAAPCAALWSFILDSKYTYHISLSR